ncbi:MAG TPA: hypothetical protein VN541_01830, partial [Tepidisphaeraceae bacterium]|nr:hypothetical protein [Tepidisphaeraceae bacterium]
SSFSICLPVRAQVPNVEQTKDRQEQERLTFQTGGPWSPRVDLNADASLVYGIGKTLPDRLKDWRDHGYRVHVMTGVAWGSYQDYLYGRWDGKRHLDEAQTRKDGSKRSHGGDVYYMSPGIDYGRYLSDGVKRALEAGAQAVVLEEPEFWVETGWGPNFKREWQAYYHQPWQPPDSSPQAQYQASKLKYFLYRRALSQVFDFVKQWSKEHNKQIPCYVATHSLINYAHWRIVSPESSLIQVGCDGYIAQVWTGTARTPNVYEGQQRERTFDAAFLEYGVMQNLVRASGRRVWYLNDPVEDNPNHTWTDYRSNWESTLTASLLQPEVWRYEIMPWPDRIFRGRHRAAPGEARVPIPKEYETELQAVISAMGDMNQPSSATHWEACGTQGTGVLVSDTMMFQRGGADASDQHLGSFYGLALPLEKRGLPVEPVQIENATSPGFLDRYKLLLLTYEGQKPPTPEFHEALAKWVRQGGALVVVDDDKDPFNAVPEWWNTSPMSFKTPREHLFKTLGIAPDAHGLSHVGKGVVLLDASSPAALTYQQDGADHVRAIARQAAGAIGLEWKESNALVLRRGPYIVAAGLDESVPDSKPYVVHGRLIPLFDANLPVVNEFAVAPGQRALLLDLSGLPQGYKGVVAAACRVRDVQTTGDGLRFHVDGIDASNGVVCVALPSLPREVAVGGKPADATSYDFAGGLLRLRFVNSATGFDVRIGW